MLSEELKIKILNERDINKALGILRKNKIENIDNDIIQHLRNITPEDKTEITDFSYSRKNK